MTSSARNAGLVGGIAKAFIEAVLQFCGHSTLQYQWMRYLPQGNEYPWDPFWKRLIDNIKSGLRGSKVLWPRSHGNLRYIQDMRRFPRDLFDKHGDPLFDDVDPEEYIASEYLFKDQDRLEEYGLRYMNIDDAITRVQKDLNQLSSRMRSPETDEDWHSRAAKLLSLPFCKKYLGLIEKVRLLRLLPLASGLWVSTNDCSVYHCSVYYPHINGVPVPGDLNLLLVDPRAAANAERKQLFDYLGVQALPAHHVRDLVMTKYKCTEIPANIDLDTSRNHLIFLYLTAHLDARSNFHIANPNLWIFDHQGRFRNPAKHHFYMPSDRPYGAQELFRSTNPGDEPGAGATGLDVCFVNQEYMKNTPEPPKGQAQSWFEWLKASLFIREKLNLTHMPEGRSELVLSDECIYVAQCRPEKFLGFLSTYWEVDGSKITARPSLRQDLLATEVLCRGNRMHPLIEAYLPTVELQRSSLKFLKDYEFFPWLKLEAPLSHEARPLEWETLTKSLGIGYPKSNLDFHLAILRFILDANPSPVNLTRVTRVYELYENIQTRCHESVDRDNCLEKTRHDPPTYSLNVF